MAAPGKHVGRYVQRNSRFLLDNLDGFWRSHRSFGWTCLLRQQVAEPLKESAETLDLPRKKTWSKEAVLEALASTVSQDPTAYPYQFQDDPYLTPRTLPEFKLYSLSMESGRSAAKYFINNNPKFFAKDFAEPHIPCLMPETIAPLLEEVSEAALKERIHLRKVGAAVDLYDQLLQAGTPVSVETTYDLLDLLCLYCDREPAQDGGPQQQQEDTQEASEEDTKRRRAKPRRSSDFLRSSWKENNNAERIFRLLQEKDTRCYSALIRGLVMHGAQEKAFSLYTDMLNNRVAGDVHIFNALLSAAPDVREKYSERWDLINELLSQMQQQKVQPDLLTFNSVLKSLKRCGAPVRSQALQTLNEMKAVGIAPSLASFNYLLAVFYKSTSSGHGNTNILHDVMSELEGSSFTCQDPDDVLFFITAMRICLDYKDLELAYRVHRLLEVGQNWRLLGDPHQQSLYYGRFFQLLCMMENIDVALQWFHRLVPSVYYPTSQALKNLLQALDTDSRLDLLPTIWKDIRSLGHDNKEDLVLELLSLMARDCHAPEVQQSFAQCALEVKQVFDEGERGSVRSLEWSNSSLSHMVTLLLRAHRSQEAWEVLQLFKTKNRVPYEGLLDHFLSVCRSDGAPQRAVELVQLSASFCLTSTPQLLLRALEEFDLSEEQRVTLTELQAAAAAEASD